MTHFIKVINIMKGHAKQVTGNVLKVLQVDFNAMRIKVDHDKDGNGGVKVLQKLGRSKIGIAFALLE